MQRVYFDWNIFSSLKKSKEESEPYISIFSIIEKNKRHLLFPYSPAHLNDLGRSFNKSERAKQLTYQDLDFLNELTLGHGLYEDYKTKKITPIVRSPREYFDEIQEMNFKDDLDFESYISTQDDTEIRRLWESLINLFKHIPSGLNTHQLDNIPAEYNKFKNLFELTNKEDNFLNLLKDVTKILNAPEEYSGAYTDSRKATIKQMKIDTNPKNWGDPFEYLDKVLSKAKVGKNFMEMMDSSLKLSNKDKPISRFDQFVNYYLSLDTFGFYSDSKVPNLMDDASHAYYGAYCDYFVSNDRRTRAKAKAVYNKLNITTKVCDAKSFPTEFYKFNFIGKGMTDSIFDEIIDAIENSLVLLNTIDNELNPSSVYKIDYPVISYFNRLQMTDYGEAHTLFLYKKKENYSDFMFWTETEALVNKVVSELGTDNYNRSFFSEEDKEELRNQTWKGRTWGKAQKFVSLYYADKPFGFSFQYQVNKNS